MHTLRLPTSRAGLGLPAALFLSILLATGCSTANRSLDQSEPDPVVKSEIIQRRANNYTIQPGDEIEISVWGYEEFNATRTVTTLGMISVPLIGEVEAVGKTQEELHADIKEKLSDYIKGDARLSVSILNSSQHPVSVLGAVGRPDNYIIPVDASSLFQVLSQAGGTNSEADLQHIKIYRDGSSRPQEVDLTVYLAGDAGSQNVPQVLPGDIVYVPVRDNAVRELSEFLRDIVLLFSLFQVFN